MSFTGKNSPWLYWLAGLILVLSVVQPARALSGGARPSAAPLDPGRISFQPVASGLTNPLFLTHAGDGSGRIFIVERGGTIRLLKASAVQPTPFLDIHGLIRSTGSEQGLLALAFHPSYAANGLFYVVYTAPRPGDSTGSNLVLERFHVSANNPDLADPASGVVLLTIPHPTYSNHNGGTLAFGPDTYLYWSVGDGGSGGDPDNNAQNLNSLLGKVLRLDVNSASPYAIPPSNPFASSSDPNIRKEIWAYGLRNPWRISFDRLTGDLFIADVGQSAHEEIDFQPAGSAGGQNYGWRVMEGSFCYNPATGCNQSGKVLPVTEYDHSLGCSVTGGYRYRGSAFPAMQGHYFYADYCSGRLWSLTGDPASGWTSTLLLDTPYSVTSFGEDDNGELYLVDYSGQVFQIQYLLPPVAIHVDIAGAQRASYNLSPGQSTRASYPNVDSFPLRVGSTNATPIIAALRDAWTPPGSSGVTSFTQFMGLPASLLSDTFYFPAYNNNTLDEQLVFDNLDTGDTTVTVTIGGVIRGTYPLGPGQQQRVNYPGLDSGPVIVKSSGGMKIIAAIREAWVPPGGMSVTSWVQIMGLPAGLLSDTYYFPAYNNVSLDEQLRFGNVGSAETDVTVTIGGAACGTYHLTPGQQQRVNYPGLDSGPVVVQSSGGVKIIAALRDAWTPPGQSRITSFAQLMGLPAGALSTKYIFPAYNNVTLDEQLRFGNVGTNATDVTVTIGGILRGTYHLNPGGQQRVNYTGLDSGPVVVESSGGVPIIAALREAWTPPGQYAITSFTQLMGMPAGLLADAYYFPSYNNVIVDEQLRFGVP